MDAVYDAEQDYEVYTVLGINAYSSAIYQNSDSQKITS
jgi:hypothetical protein